MRPVVKETEFSELPLISRGKVRDMYDLGKDVLIVVTDRLSAFDHVLTNGIPDKGRVLNLISAFWFDKTSHIVGNHLKSIDITDLPDSVRDQSNILAGRFTIARKADMLPVECIVRGYLSGSGWKDYQKTGAVCGIQLPTGLVNSDRLPEPIFTPSTKADEGHDENIPFSTVVEMIGAKHADALRDLSLRIYGEGAAYAEKRGVILADTKFEFGLIDGTITLIDEVLTPDSSRFWPGDDHQPGQEPASWDKQILRNHLETLDWDHSYPPPELPTAVLEKTSRRYHEVLEILFPAEVARWQKYL